MQDVAEDMNEDEVPDAEEMRGILDDLDVDSVELTDEYGERQLKRHLEKRETEE